MKERPTLRRFIVQAVALAVIMLSSLGGYLAVLYWRGPDAQLVTHSSWDDFFPFQPAWVWVYLIPYLIGPVIIGLLSRATFMWYVKRGLVIVGLTLSIFIVVPTRTLPREHAVTGDDPTARLYRAMIAIDDPPANAAPSLHVSLTCLLAFALLRDFPRWWWLAIPCVILVWLATLYTRQHHLFDIGTGALLACGVILLWPKAKVQA